MRNPVLPCLVAAAAILALSGCDKPKDRHVPAAAAPATPASTGAALPPLPDWGRDMIGKAQSALFPAEYKPCFGNTDNVEQKFADGVKIVGWAWDPTAKQPVARVILVDITGLIAGVGETGVTRPDVNKAKPEITSPTTGWSALTSRTTGPVDAYGIVDGGKALCQLGRLEF